MKLKFTELLLLYISEDSFVFELVEMIGLENTLKLLSVFEGETIKFPAKDFIKQTVLDLYIYTQLYRNPENVEIMQKLCFKFKVTHIGIKNRFNLVKNKLESSDILKGLDVEREKLEIQDVEKFIMSILE